MKKIIPIIVIGVVLLIMILSADCRPWKKPPKYYEVPVIHTTTVETSISAGRYEVILTGKRIDSVSTRKVKY